MKHVLHTQEALKKDGYDINLHLYWQGDAVAQSVERATPGEEVLASIPAVAARSLLVGSVSV